MTTPASHDDDRAQERERGHTRGLGLTKAALVMLGVGAIALSGVPGIGSSPGPDGSLSGLCLDHSGYAVPDARVALFDANSLELLETTRSDSEGRFAFQSTPASYSAFAEAPDDSGLSNTWVLDRTQANSSIELILREGREVMVRVVDENGRALESAEVRVYEIRRDPAMVAHERTDREGRVTLKAPPSAHIAVRAEGRPQRWQYDLDVPVEGGHYSFHLPKGRTIRGTLHGPYGPAAGIVVNSWQNAEPREWNGYTVTDAEGQFELAASVTSTELEILDPTGFHVPTLEVVGAGTNELGTITLERGNRVSVQTLDADGRSLPTRVWIWSSDAHCWSYGRETDDAGFIELMADERYSIVAEPVFGGYEALELWDKKFDTNPVQLSSRSGVAADR